MFPELITIGGFTIYTYGVVLAIAYLTAIWLSVWRAGRVGIDRKVMIDAAIIILIAAIVGAKLFYVLGHLDEMISNPGRLIDSLRAGGVFQGGLILATIAGLWYLIRKKQPIWQFADVIAPSIALGQAIGRVGCFAAGCCYGLTCDPSQVPWAVTFPAGSIAAPPGIPLHPTQLYELVLDLVVFALLTFFWKRRRFAGQIFWSYVVLYSIVRGGVVEWFRGDHGRIFLGMTGQQWISVFTLIVGVIMYFWLSSRAGKGEKRTA